MTAHISERVLLLASDERDILRRKRPEQDLVAGANDALSASSPPARCSLYLEASSGAGRLRQLQGGRASPRTSRCAGPGTCPPPPPSCWLRAPDSTSWQPRSASRSSRSCSLPPSICPWYLAAGGSATTP